MGAGHYGNLTASSFNFLAVMRGTLQASLLVGGPGTAKTSTINQFLSRFPTEEMGSKTVTFSSLTTPFIFQQAMEARPQPVQEIRCSVPEDIPACQKVLLTGPLLRCPPSLEHEQAANDFGQRAAYTRQQLWNAGVRGETAGPHIRPCWR